MENISLLLPSRKRPNNIRRLYDSAMGLAQYPDYVDMTIVIDSDDDSYEELRGQMQGCPVEWIVTERTVLSEYWNIACERAKGPIYMHAGDDLLFRSLNWDQWVRWEFEKFDDRILFAYGLDGTVWDKESFGTHGFIHQNWVDAVGYFVPPYFSSDFNDVWLNEVAKGIDRHQRLPILTEHMHFSVGKHLLDETHRERLERHERDNVEGMYNDLAHERLVDMGKLRAVML